MSNNDNFLVFIILSVAILLGFHYFYEAPRQERERAVISAQQAPKMALPQAKPAAVNALLSPRGDVLAQNARLPVSSPVLRGSINLVGGRVDDLILSSYRETLAPDSPSITLLSPTGSAPPHAAYYAEFGWMAAQEGTSVPGPQSVWRTDASALEAGGRPVLLRWDNGAGLVFEREISLDEHYMLTVTDRVRNAGIAAVNLYPYALVARHGTPVLQGAGAPLHEGAVGVFETRLEEHPYDKLADEGTVAGQAQQGSWLGFTDKYWLVALVPSLPDGAHLPVRFTHSKTQDARKDLYQADWRAEGVSVAPGAVSAPVTARLFAGPKQVDLLDAYEKSLNIRHFDLAIDFGWFYFLTKPFFYALDFLGRWSGNFGVGILILTICLRLLLFPLADKSYRSMEQMKALQPEIARLQERFGQDRVRLNQEMMELYKRERVNPLSGCLPIVIQIPIFFALYKVLFVSLEMRHAPFFGWIRDLSAADPTTIFNLFGLIPWQPPSFLMFGVWPLLMGATMYAQQLMAPQAPDPIQRKVFMFLPLFFTVLLAPMAAGLVIYWTWSNILSLGQQWVIHRRMAGLRERLANKKAS
ncbi:MAG: membrane protein insertase YidC [Alphaproteobacteria bacterium]|nr:MAG: membrane protein insertase YidC [Alphaproteobacteria bacterium]